MLDGDKEIEVKEENFYRSSPQGETQYLLPTIPSSFSSGLPHRRVSKTKSSQQLYEETLGVQDDPKRTISLLFVSLGVVIQSPFKKLIQNINGGKL